jgi:hypothetical protein
MAAGRGQFRLTWHGEKVKNRHKAGAAAGARKAAEHLLQVSRQEVPLDEGTLSRSGRVDSNGSEARAGVSYDTPYARIQHEDETFRHPGGRKAKYLSDPMVREQQTVLAIIAAEIRKAAR